jgi:hypothetical protein
VELEFRGRHRDERLDLAGVEADVAGQAVDCGTGPRERVERPVAEDLDTDLREDPERGEVDGLDLVGREDLDRPERIDQPAPRQLGEPGGGTAGPAVRAVGWSRVGRGGRVHLGMLRPQAAPRSFAGAHRALDLDPLL